MCLRVSRCCCCCNLKYGYLAFSVIVLICRVVAVTVLWNNVLVLASYLPTVANLNKDTVVPYDTAFYYSMSSSVALGYAFATSVVLIIALRGIMMERSILIFPYIVVVVLELIGNIIFHIYLIAAVFSLFSLFLIFTTVLDLYQLVCLWSLYKQITERENMDKPTAPVTNYKTAVV